jgi:cellulose synthase/poly-beta-1,6-N-acetylglucosamine synthase-like glycosyltransferase
MTHRAPIVVPLIALGVLALGPSTADGPEQDPRRDAQANEGRRVVAPRAMARLPMPPRTGREWRVPARGDLQAALNRAQPGDVISLAPDGFYRGPFRLPRKTGDGWIVIISAAADRLPPPGQRVSPADAGVMAKLRSSAHHVFATDPGAHHYRFVGLDVAPLDGAFLYNLFQLGSDERDRGAQPTDIVIDRCLLRGDPRRGSRRGVALNGRSLAVFDSYLADFKEVGADSQAIAGWNGGGPFRIANNYLEAAGENVMFGGADPSIDGLVPSDIEIDGNHLRKPLRWNADHPDFQGTAWTVKNLFELKNARRVRFEGNLLEHNWRAAQNGFAVLLTPRNQDGGAPWSVVEDVLMTGNVVRHVAGGVNILGRDDIHSSAPTRRVEIRGNLFVDLGGRWGQGRLFQLLDGTRDVSIAFNTAIHTGSVLFGGDHAPHVGFAFVHNVVQHNGVGISGSGTGSGMAAVERYFPDAAIHDNVIVGGERRAYPAGNLMVPSLADAGLIRQADGEWRQDPARCPGGRGRPCAGADVDALQRRMAAVRSEPIDATPHAGADLAAVAVFWGAGALIAYVYIGYPFLAGAGSRRARRKLPIPTSRPTVTVIVVAHNEAPVIADRLHNLLSAWYPPSKLHVLVGSDGSTDGTAARARAVRDPRVTVRAFPFRRGKPAVINDLAARATGEILVFADARQRFDRRAIAALADTFNDPSVGAASGELVLVDDAGSTTAARGAGFYWRYEKLIRAREGRTSLVGATGAIYAVRRSLFEPIPDDTILDDVLIPMRIVRRGFRIAWQPHAVAFDRLPATTRQEFARKARTTAGTFQLFTREPWLLNPVANPVWMATVSHKGLRLTLPLLHAAVAASSVALLATPFYFAVFSAQVAFYAAALVGRLWPTTTARPLVIAVPHTMCVLMAATVAGFVRFLGDRQPVTWERSMPSAPRADRYDPLRTRASVTLAAASRREASSTSG